METDKLTLGQVHFSAEKYDYGQMVRISLFGTLDDGKEYKEVIAEIDIDYASALASSISKALYD